MRHLAAAGVVPWVRIAGAAEREHGYEITYWSLPTGRSLLFVGLNPELRGTALGGGNSVGLKTNRLPITLRFNREMHDVRDERAHRSLGNGAEFALDWKQNEAVVLSFDTQ